MKIKLCIITLLLTTACINTKHLTRQNPIGTFTDDRDGQIYQWVKIGKQVWMAQNLNYQPTSGSFYYNNDPLNRAKYGLYYNFQAITSIAPKGWHIPTDIEWQLLEATAGMSIANVQGMNYRSNIAGIFLPGGETGLNVLYAGWHKQGYFDELGKAAYFWTSTQSGAPVYARMFKRSSSAVYRNRFGIAYAMSVRCVKDYEEEKP
jgi:uncharacterized protein (TIGR02145 family)